LIIVASNIFWNNGFHPSSNKSGLPKCFNYDYEIIYKKGKENVVVDALSRKYEEEGSLFSLSFIVVIG
jgi:hypothetical protein